MNIYTVTHVNPTTGNPVRGAATREYRAETARDAGRLYAAAQGLTNPVLAGTYDGNADNEFFTFKPTAPQGSRIRVHVQQVEPKNDSAAQICRDCEALGWKSLCPTCAARAASFGPSIMEAIG